MHRPCPAPRRRVGGRTSPRIGDRRARRCRRATAIGHGCAFRCRAPCPRPVRWPAWSHAARPRVSRSGHAGLASRAARDRSGAAARAPGPCADRQARRARHAGRAGWRLGLDPRRNGRAVSMHGSAVSMQQQGDPDGWQRGPGASPSRSIGNGSTPRRRVPRCRTKDRQSRSIGQRLRREAGGSPRCSDPVAGPRQRTARGKPASTPHRKRMPLERGARAPASDRAQKTPQIRGVFFISRVVAMGGLEPPTPAL